MSSTDKKKMCFFAEDPDGVRHTVNATCLIQADGIMVGKHYFGLLVFIPTDRLCAGYYFSYQP